MDAHYIGSARPYQDGLVTSCLTLQALASYSGRRGPGTALIFRDELSRIVVCHTARDFDLRPGDRIKAEFVVTSHWERNGVPENRTKRFRILERVWLDTNARS